MVLLVSTAPPSSLFLDYYSSLLTCLPDLILGHHPNLFNKTVGASFYSVNQIMLHLCSKLFSSFLSQSKARVVIISREPYKICLLLLCLTLPEPSSCIFPLLSYSALAKPSLLLFFEQPNPVSASGSFHLIFLCLHCASLKYPHGLLLPNFIKKLESCIFIEALPDHFMNSFQSLPLAPNV